VSRRPPWVGDGKRHADTRPGIAGNTIG
jgi:hypothetical protein